MPRVSLEDALRLVHVYSARESPKYETAALKWLRRYLDEGSPGLSEFAKMTASLAGREVDSLD